ncbi:RNA polymerase sigma factor [Chitinophaga flava]|uniref:RNA polymerase subunit sigma-70 n=1 Tax=Chitinophaga flava TaxID=2259036 RepID=A0A365Y175_9BACT|nr:RNA polymerase sigma factor [Chitinophaga flava]RBL92382.1 hypothetical protein DF182_07285 [Chitinophaga flava]
MKTEQQLVEQAKSDPNAFGELYDQYYSKIFNYAFRITGDYVIACDIAAETFMKAFTKINSFQWKGISVSSWFFKIATNELNQYFRSKKYTSTSLTELGAVENTSGYKHFSDETNDTISRIYMTEDFKRVQQLLQSLPPDYQKVIALKYFEEMSIKEISEIMGKKEGTIKSLISRGIDRLRQSL